MLVLYNTLTRKKEEFVPCGQEVRFYSCGPTVYNYAHIGNLRAYVFSDILKRTLLYNGYKVKHVMNITDVGHLTSDEDSGEDKMEKGASREKKTVWEIANFYTESFKKDIALLNILPPDVYSKATDHIKEQIDLIKKIEEKGYSYTIEDGVYFDTSRLKDYGKLAQLDIEGLMAGRRVEMAAGKKNPTDFALWKFSPKDKKRAMEWDSPWGTGFPGWHIECSAMSMHYLGETFDIHTGGIDHIPVHHTNEIAQAETATGKDFVKYWLHNEFLVMGKEKMAKSGEGFITLQRVIDKGIDPMDYRYFLLNSHYRKPVTFTWEGLSGAGNGMAHLKEKVIEIKGSPSDMGSEKIPSYIENFKEALNDDFNTPRGLAVMWSVIKDDTLGNNQKMELLLDFDTILALGIEKIKEESKNIEPVDEEVEKLVEERQNARKNKNWALSDELRKKITEKGYVVSDTPQGPVVKKI
ncbi:MAG: cysteine--tRNA ligase [Candidatus Eremiobacterota bacterium]